MDFPRNNGQLTEVKKPLNFSPSWFAKFPAALNHDANDYKPTSEAPSLGKGTVFLDAPADRNGVARAGNVDLGPIEVP